MTDTPQDNPFQTPAALLHDLPSIAAGASLYKISAVGIATFFGLPVAGAWVITQNLKRLGRPQEARSVWLTGIALTVAIFVIGQLLPANMSGMPMVIATLVFMVGLAKQRCESALKEHAAAAGRFASNWRAFGVSLLFLLGVLAVIFVGAVILSLLGLI
ncbi:hypothetical protein P3W53_10035 [Pseudomonas denitrificans (nom. rej.)]|nr:hypothetical protein [Pseudomonas denitrificans (nom. rej.)]